MALRIRKRRRLETKSEIGAEFEVDGSTSGGETFMPKGSHHITGNQRQFVRKSQATSRCGLRISARMPQSSRPPMLLESRGHFGKEASLLSGILDSFCHGSQSSHIFLSTVGTCKRRYLVARVFAMVARGSSVLSP